MPPSNLLTADSRIRMRRRSPSRQFEDRSDLTLQPISIDARRQDSESSGSDLRSPYTTEWTRLGDGRLLRRHCHLRLPIRGHPPHRSGYVSSRPADEHPRTLVGLFALYGARRVRSGRCAETIAPQSSRSGWPPPSFCPTRPSHDPRFAGPTRYTMLSLQLVAPTRMNVFHPSPLSTKPGSTPARLDPRRHRYRS